MSMSILKDRLCFKFHFFSVELLLIFMSTFVCCSGHISMVLATFEAKVTVVIAC